ncbi:hypothetical protein SISNIDRAFT_467906 [Sistotremastrum niveocremeum HHB9708]|uniref:Uncharacterized protein n=1 Tax=Sistotremastrum niveocremeum HHB9708 TaxID=1314777 RepID=A0A164SC62_9AGAM|nr:hypothetical protein SISNIDRAFT_467906 [Sistotremastrum niveocremeum HHB9708]
MSVHYFSPHSSSLLIRVNSVSASILRFSTRLDLEVTLTLTWLEVVLQTISALSIGRSCGKAWIEHLPIMIAADPPTVDAGVTPNPITPPSGAGSIHPAAAPSLSTVTSVASPLGQPAFQYTPVNNAPHGSSLPQTIHLQRQIHAAANNRPEVRALSERPPIHGLAAVAGLPMIRPANHPNPRVSNAPSRGRTAAGPTPATKTFHIFILSSVSTADEAPARQHCLARSVPYSSGLEFKWHESEVPHLQTLLHRMGMAHTLELPATGPVYQQLWSHFTSIAYPDQPVPSHFDFEELPFHVLVKKRAVQHVSSYLPQFLGQEEFTVDRLMQSDFRRLRNHVTHGMPALLVWIAATFPLSYQVQHPEKAHACWARRMDSLAEAAFRRSTPRIALHVECLPQCPGQSPSPSTSNPAAALNPPSTENVSAAAPAARNVQQATQPVLVSAPAPVPLPQVPEQSPPPTAPAGGSDPLRTPRASRTTATATTGPAITPQHSRGTILGNSDITSSSDESLPSLAEVFAARSAPTGTAQSSNLGLSSVPIIRTPRPRSASTEGLSQRTPQRARRSVTTPHVGGDPIPFQLATTASDPPALIHSDTAINQIANPSSGHAANLPSQVQSLAAFVQPRPVQPASRAPTLPPSSEKPSLIHVGLQCGDVGQDIDTDRHYIRPGAQHPSPDELSLPPLDVPSWSEIDRFTHRYRYLWHRRDQRSLEIAAPNDVSAARILWWWIAYVYLELPQDDDIFEARFSIDFPSGSRCQCNRAPLEGLLSPSCSIDSGPGTGAGVTRVVIAKAIEMLTSDASVFAKHGDFTGIQWSLSSDEGLTTKNIRHAKLFATSFLTVTSVMLDKIVPTNLSPFLLSAAYTGLDQCILHPTMLQRLDADSFATLKPWFNNIADAGEAFLADKKGSPLGQLLAGLDIDGTAIATPLSVAGAKVIERSLYYALLLGNSRPIGHEDFLAFRQGLAWYFGPNHRTSTAGRLPFEGLDFVGLLTRLYDRRVRSPEEVIKLIDFRISVPIDFEGDQQSTVRSEEIKAEKDFQQQFKRYLRGVGDPDMLNIRHMLGEERFQAGVGQKALRASLFLKLVTGSVLPPAPASDTSAGKPIRIIFLHNHNRRVNVKDIDHMHPLEVHACFRTVDVTIDRRVRNLLAERHIPGCSASDGDGKSRWKYSARFNIAIGLA